MHRLDAERLSPERRELLDALVAVGLIIIGGLGPTARGAGLRPARRPASSSCTRAATPSCARGPSDCATALPHEHRRAAPLNRRALAALTLTRATVRAYVRHVYLPAAAAPDPLWVNAAALSRFQTLGGTLYLAEDPATVWAELCRARAAEVAAADPTGGVGLHPDSFAYYAGPAARRPGGRPGAHSRSASRGADCRPDHA